MQPLYSTVNVVVVLIFSLEKHELHIIIPPRIISFNTQSFPIPHNIINGVEFTTILRIVEFLHEFCLIVKMKNRNAVFS